MKVFDWCLDYYQHNCLKGERFGEILERTGVIWSEEAQEDIGKRSNP